MAKRKWRYVSYLEQSIKAMRSSIDRLNSVQDDYGKETAMILAVNAWELLAKAYLIKKKKPIRIGKSSNSISAEEAVHRLVLQKELNDLQEDHIQQLISLRNAAIHDVPPSKLPDEVLFHLMFFAAKFFKDLIGKTFPSHVAKLSGNYLSIGFDSFTTYADRIQKLVSRARKHGTSESQLVWLLERGIRFEGGSYLTQSQFEREMRKTRGKKILPRLRIGNFLKKAEMIVVVPIQAPKGYTADINLRKGSRQSRQALPVFIKKTNIDDDYPYLTGELASKIGKNVSFVAVSSRVLGVKGDEKYHVTIRSSKSSKVHRYSEAALHFFQEFLKKNPSYNPFKQ